MAKHKKKAKKRAKKKKVKKLHARLERVSRAYGHLRDDDDEAENI